MFFQAVNLCLIFALFVTATSFQLRSDHVLHEKRDVEGSPWTKRARLPETLTLPVNIALTQNNIGSGHERLMEISDPASSRYGQHYTAEEVRDLFAPSPDAISSVHAWLRSNGIDPFRIQTSTSKHRVYIENMTVVELETLLDAEYYVLEDSESKIFGVACDSYYVPKHVADHIDFISPGVGVHKIKADNYSSKRSERAVASRSANSVEQDTAPVAKVNVTDLKQTPGAQSCHEGLSPQCIQILYNITSQYKSVSGNQVGIYEDSRQYYQGDLNNFFAEFLPNIPNGTHPTVHSIDGGIGKTSTVPSNDTDFEAAIDLDIAYTLLNPGDVVMYPTDDEERTARGFTGLFNNFLDGIDASYCNYSAYGETGNDPTYDEKYPDPDSGGYKGQTNCGRWAPTNVISISYGLIENNYPMSYTRRQCNEFMKLSLQGYTIVASSGDYGVDFIGLGPKYNIFTPMSPVSCPYVLAVGATTLLKNGSVYRTNGEGVERAPTDFASGGGFSNIFPQPSYQKSQVESYLTKYPPPFKSYSGKFNSSFGAGGGMYNQAGRAYPDVSAIGDNIIFSYQKQFVTGEGTSASAPLWAAMLTRVNAARLAAGKATIGFVQPVLYANPQIFYDITIGSNPGFNTPGFNAEPGWDPVTGLGTPDFGTLMEVFMALN